MQTDRQMEHNKPNITVIEKKNKIYQLIDPSCSFDSRIEKNEEKSTYYCDLMFEIKGFGR